MLPLTVSLNVNDNVLVTKLRPNETRCGLEMSLVYLVTGSASKGNMSMTSLRLVSETRSDVIEIKVVDEEIASSVCRLSSFKSSTPILTMIVGSSPLRLTE